MKEFTYTVKDPEGIHARPAGQLAKLSAAFQAAISITKGEKSVDMKRIIGLMSMGVKKDETVTIKADGNDEHNAIVSLEKFFKENL